MYSVDTGGGFLGTLFDDKLAGTLSLGKMFFVATICATEIGDSRAVSICSDELGYGLSGSNGSLVLSFSSSSVVLRFRVGKSASSSSYLST